MVPMSADLACMLCSIDPGAVNLVAPVAQATIISLPFLFRDQIKRVAVGLRARWRAESLDTEGTASPPAVDVEDLEPPIR